jgi:GntR family transcriptional regulator, trigonelline degradation regulator
MQMLQREAAPLRTQLVARLRQDIVAGRFGAGDRLIEKNLEAEYGVSRTVVREALRQLESERLVEIVPNIGPQVRALTYDDVVHLYQVRDTLESAACGLAAQRGSVPHIKGLRLAFERLTKRASVMDVSELIEEKNAFYRALIDASGNPIIGEMLDNVQARISQLRAITLSSADRTPRMLAELREVVEAIEAGDSVAATEATHIHVAAAAEIALAHIRDPSSEDGGSLRRAAVD